MLCKHEVVGSIPSGSTRRRVAGSLAGLPVLWKTRVSHSSLQEGEERGLSDIVKRKRIRSKGWGEEERLDRKIGFFVSSWSGEHLSRGFRLDRWNSRMRLKQNWSFQKVQRHPEASHEGEGP